jgi:hypothetical protein
VSTHVSGSGSVLRQGGAEGGYVSRACLPATLSTVSLSLQRLQPLLNQGAVNGDGVHIHNSHSQISAHVPRMTTKAITAAISTE